MARDPQIEQRLQRWAQWCLVGDGSGFPVVSVLHPNWSPPAPGVRPALKVGHGSDVRETHRMVGRLPPALTATVVAHYVMRGTVAEQALRLNCQPNTVLVRVAKAHRMLAALVAGQDDTREDAAQGAAGACANSSQSGRVRHPRGFLTR